MSDPKNRPNEGLHEEIGGGERLTVNNTEDKKYPDGSYYQSQSTPDSGHVTTIYGPDGEELDEKEGK